VFSGKSQKAEEMQKKETHISEIAFGWITIKDFKDLFYLLRDNKLRNKKLRDKKLREVTLIFFVVKKRG
jgi:hypothetical protein